jgi:glycine C-acetyltransferase/8-amino-7-oxononanoate synthase
MDGDVAPIARLTELARRYGARLMVDDAHAVGALGPGGRGTVAEAGLEGEVDVIVGTLGKALGSYGAYACTSAEVRELLVNTARPLIFSTGLAPSCAAAAEAALGIIQGHPERVARLRRHASGLRAALRAENVAIGDSASQIVPVLIGDPDRAVAACRRALDDGVYAQAIRPPTVPDGTSRLRLTVSAAHTSEELNRAAAVIARSVRAVAATGEWSIDLPDPPDGAIEVRRSDPAADAGTPESPAPVAARALP